MPRGMTRTTIMSHGRSHDAKGVRGVHLRGSVPEAKVLDAIPADVGSVGNLPDTAMPGDPASTAVRSAMDITPGRRARRDAEGDIVMPGGNRDGVATARPSVETVSPSPVSTLPDPADEPVVLLPEPAAVTEPTTVVEDTPEPVEEAQAHPTEPETPALPATKRKLLRASVGDLQAWCELLQIIPAEYVEDDDEVTTALMRVLVGDKLGIKHGIKLAE